MSLEANSFEEVFDKLRSQTRSLAHIVKRAVILCFILVFRISSVVCNGGLVVAVRKLSKRWYRNFFSVSNWAAADGWSVYWRQCQFFLLMPGVLMVQK